MTKKTVTVELSSFQEELLEKSDKIGSLVYAYHPSRGVIEDVVVGLSVNGEKVFYMFRGSVMQSLNRELIAFSKAELDAKIDDIKKEEVAKVEKKYEKIKSKK